MSIIAITRNFYVVKLAYFILLPNRVFKKIYDSNMCCMYIY